MEILKKRILSVILNKKVSSYDYLVLQIGDCSLSNTEEDTEHNNYLQMPSS